MESQNSLKNILSGYIPRDKIKKVKRTPKEWAGFTAQRANSEVGELDIMDGYNCKICKNRGYIFEVREYDGNYQAYQIPCKCMKARRAIAKLKASGLEKSVAAYKLESFKAVEPWQKNMLNMAHKFLKEPDTWMFIGGQQGSGKTHICTGVARELLLKNHFVMYKIWRDFLTELKAEMFDGDKYKTDIDAARNTEILYIDDFFKPSRDQNGNTVNPTATDIQIAFEVINYRYINNLRTIISSELYIDSIINIDEAVASRIIEKADSGTNCINIKYDKTKNYRLKGIRTI